MARRGRVEFAGAVYHVLDRGDRQEPIVRSDGDRAAFVRTLAQVCERTGWRVHAFVLMSNHYHLLIETPQPISWPGCAGFRRHGPYRSIGITASAGICFKGATRLWSSIRRSEDTSSP